jgi:hypothetical protein
MMQVVYDLGVSQPTYWFAVTLLGAEHERLRRGDDGLDVLIVPGLNGKFGKLGKGYKYWPVTIEASEQYMDAIVWPMTKLLPSIRSARYAKREEMPPDAYDVGGGKGKIATNVFIHAISEGVRPFRPVHPVRRDPLLVTLTLRECGKQHWAIRDCNAEAWLAAAYELQARGYRVVVVRDTARADEPLKGIMTLPSASKDLLVRSALYSSAAANLFVSNGPGWFAFALDVPVLMFRPTCDNAGKSHDAVTMARSGIIQGQQLRGAVPYQRLVWEEDTPQRLVDEAEAMVALTQRLALQQEGWR